MGILDSLFSTKYLGFIDIEFQILQTAHQEPHILELGLIIFEKNNDIPILIEHVNFPLLINANVRLLTSKYCTTTEKTEIAMKELEKQFSINIRDFESIKNKKDMITFIPNKQVKELLKQVVHNNDYTLISSKYTDEKINSMQKAIDKSSFNLFKNRLSNKYSDMFNNIMNLYKNDDLVKKRNVNPKQYLEKLREYLSNMTLVHKEDMDILALNNDLRKYNVPVKHKLYHKDIADYNDILIKKYNTAKLYESYQELKKEYILKDITLKEFDEKLYETLQVKMPVIKAHNPLSDCYFTVLVFLVMNRIKHK
jgi:hypothetical protein